MSRFRLFFAPLLLTALTPLVAEAGTATVFAMKRGRAVARVENAPSVVLLPGIDIPAGARVKVEQGELGVKLPDGTCAYFGGGTSFRLTLPETREQPPEIILLSGGVVLATEESDFIVRCISGTAEVGDCTAAIVFSPKQENAPASMVVRVASGSVRANPAGGTATTVGKDAEAVFPLGAEPVSGPLRSVSGATIIEASQGGLAALRSALRPPPQAK